MIHNNIYWLDMIWIILRMDIANPHTWLCKLCTYALIITFRYIYIYTHINVVCHCTARMRIEHTSPHVTHKAPQQITFDQRHICLAKWIRDTKSCCHPFTSQSNYPNVSYNPNHNCVIPINWDWELLNVNCYLLTIQSNTLNIATYI